MSKLRFPTASSLVTGLLLACSGSSCSGNSGPPATDALPASNDSGSTGGAGGIAFGALPAKYAAAICTAYQNCLGPIFSLFFGGTDCVDLTTQRLENGTFALMQQKITA